MQIRRPGEPEDISSGESSADGARVIDLTARHPARFMPIQPPKRRFEWTRRRIGMATALLVLVSAFAGGLLTRSWSEGAARSAAFQLTRQVERPQALEVRWPSQEDRVLRLVGLSDRHKPLSYYERETLPELSPEVERMGELWLLTAAKERSDQFALRTLGAYHIKNGDSPRILVLGVSELEDYIARNGPSPSTLNDLAVGEALLGRREQALDYLEQALRLGRDEPVDMILYNAAQVARSLGPSALSVERDYLERYLARDSGSTWRPAMAARLQSLSRGFDTRIRFPAGQSGGATVPAVP